MQAMRPVLLLLLVLMRERQRMLLLLRKLIRLLPAPTSEGRRERGEAGRVTRLRLVRAQWVALVLLLELELVLRVLVRTDERRRRGRQALQRQAQLPVIR